VLALADVKTVAPKVTSTCSEAANPRQVGVTRAPAGPVFGAMAHEAVSGLGTVAAGAGQGGDQDGGGDDPDWSHGDSPNTTYFPGQQPKPSWSQRGHRSVSRPPRTGLDLVAMLQVTKRPIP
jgi:hypothetical protein